MCYFINYQNISYFFVFFATNCLKDYVKGRISITNGNYLMINSYYFQLRELFQCRKA